MNAIITIGFIAACLLVPGGGDARCLQQFSSPAPLAFFSPTGSSAGQTEPSIPNSSVRKGSSSGGGGSGGSGGSSVAGWVIGVIVGVVFGVVFLVLAIVGICMCMKKDKVAAATSSEFDHAKVDYPAIQSDLAPWGGERGDE